MRNFFFLAKRSNKHDIETALQGFQEITALNVSMTSLCVHKKMPNDPLYDILIFMHLMFIHVHFNNDVSCTPCWMMEQQTESVGAMFGEATSYMLLKMEQKAKVILKKICATEWNIDDGEFYEKSWLLSADIYMRARGSAKLEKAKGFLMRCIDKNKVLKRHTIHPFITCQTMINFFFSWSHLFFSSTHHYCFCVSRCSLWLNCDTIMEIILGHQVLIYLHSDLHLHSECGWP